MGGWVTVQTYILAVGASGVVSDTVYDHYYIKPPTTQSFTQYASRLRDTAIFTPPLQYQNVIHQIVFKKKP